ncbi:GLPGLI family protein [Flavobacterium sp.]|jgi:GLPGLI family protein|uniref:GLPGLI family protein n=1 Tax=Flavobacterium sp. TaxID=239 RepID=UPI0037BF9536
MKKIVLFLVITVGFSSFSQEKTKKNADFWMSYQMDYKKFVSSETTHTVNTILIINNQGSLFTFEPMMNLDKIQQERALTEADVLLNISPFDCLIKINGNITEHYEAIGSDSYKFEEKLDYDWKLINQDTLIKGYSCKKAVLNHFGREWIAWYTSKIPVSAGPYKFNGLPGLILDIRDTGGFFKFSINEIKTGTFAINPKTENYFINEEGKPFETIKPDAFYETRIKFYQLSLNEKLQYMNRGSDAVPTGFIVTGINGEKVRTNAKPKDKSFIERYQY